MADYSSSGIWVIDGAPSPWRHGMIEHQELGLSTSLAERFNDWIRRYARHQDGFDFVAYNAEGFALAKELKQALGPDTYVEFDKEWPIGQEKPESVVIE